MQCGSGGHVIGSGGHAVGRVCQSGLQQRLPVPAGHQHPRQLALRLLGTNTLLKEGWILISI